jgi:transposase-like protein
MTNDRSLKASVITRPLRHCPSCESDQLQPVVEASADVHFLCRQCGRCWNVALGRVTRVAPPTCFGCPERGRCELVYARDHTDAPTRATD